jgi:hypothetical protein
MRDGQLQHTERVSASAWIAHFQPEINTVKSVHRWCSPALLGVPSLEKCRVPDGVEMDVGC